MVCMGMHVYACAHIPIMEHMKMCMSVHGYAGICRHTHPYHGVDVDCTNVHRYACVSSHIHPLMCHIWFA